MASLTPKQKLFVIHYAITRNGVEAVRLAGYKGTYESMKVEASRLLSNANLLKAYDAYMRPFFEGQGITVQRTLEHIADLAYAPWGDFVQVKERNGQIVSVQMPLKVKADMLVTLAKMLRLIGKEDNDATTLLDQSQQLHLHNYRTADECRQGLLNYLKNYK